MRLDMTMTRLPLCGASVASSWLAGLFGASLLWNFIYSIGSRVVTDETHYRLHDSVTTWGGIAGVLAGLAIVLLLRRPAPGVLAIGHALALVTGFFGGSVGWQQGLWAYFGALVALVIWVVFRAPFRFRSRREYDSRPE